MEPIEILAPHPAPDTGCGRPGLHHSGRSAGKEQRGDLGGDRRGKDPGTQNDQQIRR